VTNGVAVFQRAMDKMVDEKGLKAPSHIWTTLQQQGETNRNMMKI